MITTLSVSSRDPWHHTCNIKRSQCPTVLGSEPFTKFACKSWILHTYSRNKSTRSFREKRKFVLRYWRMQNNCTTSDRFKRFVFQRCRLLLVVNVKKKYTQCKYATLYGYETVARWAISFQTCEQVIMLRHTHAHKTHKRASVCRGTHNLRTYSFKSVNVRTEMHTHTYTHTYTHIRTYIHTHTQTHKLHTRIGFRRKQN
jgi:hypothetical protein